MKVRTLPDAVEYEVSVFYDHEPLFARVFATLNAAEREADDVLKEMLAGGWFQDGV